VHDISLFIYAPLSYFFVVSDASVGMFQGRARTNTIYATLHINTTACSGGPPWQESPV